MRCVKSTDRLGSGCLHADAFIFDIDGTLLNTRDLVHWNALRRAMLEVYDRDTDIDGIPYHGNTDIGILRLALGRVGISPTVFEERLPEALALVCHDVTKNVAGIQPDVCAFVPELLKHLRSEGKLLGVASGNLEVVGWHKVRAANISEFFSFGCFSDPCETRAAIFQQARSKVYNRLSEYSSVCFVGDTPADIQAARAVNGSIIAVSTGTFSHQELESHGPDKCFASCREFLAAVSQQSF